MKRDHPKGDSLLTETRKLLRRYGLQARKGLGQHFLIDEDVVSTIITAAELSPSDIVMEIGPGLGVLTRELVAKAGFVITIELDNRLAATLKESLSSFSNVAVINEDVLKTDPETLLGEQKPKYPQEVQDSLRYKVVANLPYYITSPVLRHFLEASIKPQLMVVMVQKEVAGEIVAKPGRMSLLSISVQLYGEPEIIDYVPARCFYPEPEVDSAILKVSPYPQPAVEIADRDSFFRLVKSGFSASRKQLANSLAQGMGTSKSEALTLLARAEIAPQRRAETLSLDEWVKLWRVSTGVGEPC